WWGAANSSTQTITAPRHLPVDEAAPASMPGSRSGRVSGDYRDEARARLVIGRLVAEVRIVDRAVRAARGEQRPVVTGLHDPAVVEHDEPVGVLDGGEPVCDDDRGASLEDNIQPFLDLGLGERVDARGRLVQDDHRRV